jgi:hypothetical protein
VSAAGPSDAGLGGERTTLAWSRLGMALLALPAGLVAHAAAFGLVPALVVASVAAAAGLTLLVMSLRRQRAPAAMLAVGEPVVAARQVVLAGATVSTLGLAALLVLLAG